MNPRKVKLRSNKPRTTRTASSRAEQDSRGPASRAKPIPVNSGIKEDSSINTVTSLASRAILQIRMRRAARTVAASNRVKS